MDNFFENDYVRVGLPVLMGVAAASSPAGARGAGAMLSSLGAIQGIAEGKERREGERARTSIQRLKLEQEERQAKQPKIEYRDGQWYAIDQEGKITPTGVRSGERQRLEDILSGKAPTPGQASSMQPTGLPGSLPPDVERMVSDAERNVQAQIPGAQVSREGPSTPTSVDPGRREARLRALASTPEGVSLIYMSGDQNLIKYVEQAGKDDREIRAAVAKQQALRPGEISQRVETEQALQPLMVERQRQQGAAGVGLSVARQGAMRAEEMQARGTMTVREAEQQGMLKDEPSARYFDKQTGENKPEYAFQSVNAMNRRETSGEVRLLSMQNAPKMYGYQEAVPIFQGIRDDIATIYGTGIFQGLKPGDRIPAAVKGTIARWLQTDTPLATAVKNLEAAKTRISQIQGQKGVLTERDVQAALESLPTLTGMPDTVDVAYKAFNNLIRATNRHIGALLGNKDFRHPQLQELDPFSSQQEQKPTVREDLLQRFDKGKP